VGHASESLGSVRDIGEGRRFESDHAYSNSGRRGGSKLESWGVGSILIRECPGVKTIRNDRRSCMNRSAALALAVGAALGIAACGKTELPQQKATMEDLKKEAKEFAASVKDLALQTKEAFVANAEKELAEMDGKIKELESRAKQAQGETKANLDRAVAQLEKQRQAAKEKLKAIKETGGDAWKDMKAGFDGAWEEMRRGYEAVKGT
jgi:chromosome segregation ATPase